MNKVMMMVLMLLLIPGVVLAMEHDMSTPKDNAIDHSKMENAEANHNMDGMIMLGSEEIDGVKALFHLTDVKMEMMKAGQPFTHHLMVNFIDVKTGKAIEDGRVAVKMTTPDNIEGIGQMMMGMDGHFGVDLVLAEKGTYNFKIGTRLMDAKKREFQPRYQM